MAHTVATDDLEATVQRNLQERRVQFGASITRTVVWIAVVVIMMTLGIYLFFPLVQLLVLVGLFALMLVLSALYPLFRRRGQATWGLRLFLFSGVLVVSFFPVLLPPLLLAVMGDYIVLVAMGYRLLGERDGHVLGGLCAIFLLANYYLVQLWSPPWLIELGEPAGAIVGGAFGGATLLVAVAIVFLITRGQRRSLYQAQRATLEVEQRARAEQKQRELVQQANAEIEERIEVERQQREQLVHLLEQVRDAVGTLTSAASEILATTTQQATGASEQSAALTQVVTTLEEVRTISEQTTQRAQGVVDAARRTAEVSEAGQEAVAESIQSMTDIREKVEAIAKNVLDLSARAQAVGQIIATVGEIATQSNMLALNAAVEAARAGEAGRGFAVVAGEVRALAEQSQTATEQVRDLLTEIQRGVNTVVMATEEGMKGTDVGVRRAGEAGASIERLSEGVSQSVNASSLIVTAADQQQHGIEQIVKAMQEIRQVADQTMAGAQQVEEAAAELNTLAGQLREVVTQYWG